MLRWQDQQTLNSLENLSYITYNDNYLLQNFKESPFSSKSMIKIER